MLDPDTASKQNSIWRNFSEVNRLDFDSQVSKLSDQGHSPGRRVNSLQTKLNIRYIYPLSIDQECRLVEDFAFLACPEEGARGVTVAVIEFQETLEKNVLRIAANEGIQSSVIESINTVLLYMHQCASGVRRERACRKDMYTEVFRFNRTYVRSRVVGKKWRNTVEEPLHQKLRKKMQQVRTALRPLPHEDPADFIRDVDDFITACEELLTASGEDELQICTATVCQQAYKLSKDGIRLAERISEAGLKSEIFSHREAQEIQKLASYWRIPRNLAKLSRTYPKIFTNLILSPIDHYSVSTRASTQFVPKRFVHAEIQILTYYELNPPDLSPRVIGASKDACFLCGSFLRAHGVYQVPRAHRKIYHQWTVPDLDSYSRQTVNKFRRCLEQVYQDIKEQTQLSTLNTTLPHPLQSTVNLCPQGLISDTSLKTDITIRARNSRPSASNSTRTTGETVVSGTVPEVSSKSVRLDQSKDTSSSDGRDSGIEVNNSEISTLDQSRSQNATLATQKSTAPIITKQEDANKPSNTRTVTVDTRSRSQLVRCGWLEAFASLESSPGDSSIPLQLKTPRGVVQFGLIPHAAETSAPYVEYEDLISSSKSIQFERNYADRENELCFVVRRSWKPSVLVTCVWHPESGGK